MTRLTLLFPLVALAACAGEGAPPQTGDVPAEVATFDFAAPISDASVYLLDAPWTTDVGEPLALADLRGRPVAVAMVYGHCGTACPLIVQDMKTLGAQADGLGLQYVLVTLDPERDTPERLHALRQMYGLGDDWTLLHGAPDDVQVLAAVLGVRYRPEADGSIAHSNLITLLDTGGEPVARQEGLGSDPAPAVAALQTALALNS